MTKTIKITRKELDTIKDRLLGRIHVKVEGVAGIYLPGLASHYSFDLPNSSVLCDSKVGDVIKICFPGKEEETVRITSIKRGGI